MTALDTPEVRKRETESAAYTVAHFVRLPSDALARWLAVMRMCGYVIERQPTNETARKK